ncbi:MAG TPA: SRPBCC family protein, partial [Ktedonobacteraceae bacterium]|nr:SRPBCC family protein [Ktedonobacteraceae bacterium]
WRSAMGLSVCPAAIIAAPVEQVWPLLQPARLSEWADGRVEGSVPEGAPFVGQTFSVVSRALGRDWRADFTVEKVDATRHQLAMHVRFPFGMQLHEHVSCTPIDASSCRVQYG